ncbi:signal peptidase II [candidate division KSB1 bacterium]|nr:signal peptidase II [candidate division KSB1 bacterium]
MKLLWPFLTALVLDQITKQVIRMTMFVGQSNEVIGNFVRLTFVENRGMAFGIQIGNGLIFTILSIIASIGIAVYLYFQRNESRGITLSLSLILGGAIGNLIDRILFGRVVDFMDFGIGTTRWPVFNVADSAVVIGMGILIVTTYIVERSSDPSPKKALSESGDGIN